MMVSNYIGTSDLARILNNAGLIVTAGQLQKMCIRGTFSKAIRPTYAHNRTGHWRLDLATTFHEVRRYWGDQLTDKQWLDVAKAFKAMGKPLYRQRETCEREPRPVSMPLLELLEGFEHAKQA